MFSSGIKWTFHCVLRYGCAKYKNNNKRYGVFIISERVIYQGKVIDLLMESVKLPGGMQTELEIIRHPGGAVALALNEADEICLIRQYRHATGGWLWELPGGRIEAGEEPLVCAERELREEVGLAAENWEPLVSFWSTPGFCREILYLFCATGLSEAALQRDPDEVIETHWLPVSRALEWFDNGIITDAKTMLGLYSLARKLESKKKTYE